MKIEDALKLKKGTILEASESWLGPEVCTEGGLYVMQDDAVPVYSGSGLNISYQKLRPDQKPCNVYLPIIDDRGDLEYPSCISFEVSH